MTFFITEVYATTFRYRRSSDSADSISAVPGLVRIANRTILPKFPDLVWIANHSRMAFGWPRSKNSDFYTKKSKNSDFYTEKTGPSDQKFSKSPLKVLDEALELLSD